MDIGRLLGTIVTGGLLLCAAGLFVYALWENRRSKLRNRK